MVPREIEVDEETDRLLTELAAQHHGRLSEVLADLVRANEGLEAFVEASEASQGSALRAMRDQAERDFTKGRGVPWEKVKADNGL